MMPDFEWRGGETYLDNAATTMIDPSVVDAMQPYLEERYGNPETVYELGREASDAVEKSRHVVAEMLGCLDEEVFFTSGGTESNNWAIKGISRGNGQEGVIVGAVEHSSVLEPAKWMCQDAPYCEIPVDPFGMIDLDRLENELKTGRYALVSVQYGNNEVGTLQPVAEVSRLCVKHAALFHCDAVQAYGKVKLDVDDIGADMISISAHKIHGPMGVGALYVRKGTVLEPLIHGGGQESGMRSGTTAVHQVVGFGKASELASESVGRDMQDVFGMVENAARDVVSRVPGTVRNGHPTLRLPHILNITVRGLEAGLACGLMCSKHGICVSSGAACHTRSQGSHVLVAMGRGADVGSTLRISASRHTRATDLSMFVSMLQAVVAESRSRSLV
jgi:cysteine desulfurase